MQSSKPKLHTLESLRGIAAILVVFLHSKFYSSSEINLLRINGGIWVDFFFILSGFVMGYAYFSKVSSHTISFKKFISLRFGRLFPLNTFILLLWVPYVIVKIYAFNQGYGHIDPIERHSPLQFISNLFLIQSLNLHDQSTWNGPAWSISTEFFTYIFYFFTVSALYKTFPKIKIFYNMLFLVTLSLLAYYLLIVLNDNKFFATYNYGVLRCIGGFFLGLLIYQLYLLLKNKKSILNKTIIFHCIEIFLTLLIIFLLYKIRESNLYIFTLILVFALTILVLALQSNGIMSKILSHKLLRYLGKLSYSIYLCHALILVVASNFFQYILKVETAIDPVFNLKVLIVPYSFLLNIVFLLIVILFSHYTYNLIEKPFRNRFRTIAKHY
jgi:peptidoglycan/LPS O-acetylase OafA/YrhL